MYRFGLPQKKISVITITLRHKFKLISQSDTDLELRNLMEIKIAVNLSVRQISTGCISISVRLRKSK